MHLLIEKPKLATIVNNIEEKEKILVYHCILEHKENEDLLIMLYVSDKKEDWYSEMGDLAVGFIKAYIFNINQGNYELVDIEIKGINKGIARNQNEKDIKQQYEENAEIILKGNNKVKAVSGLRFLEVISRIHTILDGLAEIDLDYRKENEILVDLIRIENSVTNIETVIECELKNILLNK